MARVTHLADLMHRAEASNGTAIPSNWIVSTDGTKAVTWRPESAGGSVSYGSNATHVSDSSDGGAAASASRSDHRHLGVRSVSHSSNTYFGDITLQTEGSLYIVKPGPGILKFGSTGGGGGGGGGTTITTKDEGSTLSTGVTTLDFTGAGVTASGSGATTTVNIPGGSGGLTAPTLTQLVTAGNATTSVTIAAAASGHSLVMLTDSTTGQVTSPSCTNVTWTQIKTFTSAGSSFYAIWIGVVAGGSSGTSITMTIPGSFNSVAVLEVNDTLTPTLGQNVAAQVLSPGFGVTNMQRISGHTSGRLVVFGMGVDNTTFLATLAPSIPMVGVARTQATALGVGYATSQPVTVSSDSNAGAIFICEVS